MADPEYSLELFSNPSVMTVTMTEWSVSPASSFSSLVSVRPIAS